MKHSIRKFIVLTVAIVYKPFREQRNKKQTKKYAEDENIDGILFAADTEKAFDSVDHNFMFTALKRFGFGNDFVW